MGASVPECFRLPRDAPDSPPGSRTGCARRVAAGARSPSTWEHLHPPQVGVTYLTRQFDAIVLTRCTLIAMPVIRPAQLDDALAMARVHVDTWRTSYVGIVPDEHLANLSYERCQANWIEHLSRPQDETHAFVAEAQAGHTSWPLPRAAPCGTRGPAWMGNCN